VALLVDGIIDPAVGVTDGSLDEPAVHAGSVACVIAIRKPTMTVRPSLNRASPRESQA